MNWLIDDGEMPMDGISLYGNYRTRKFTDAFPDEGSFAEEYAASGLDGVLTSSSSITVIYYLLYARYGNSHIANSDENQFRYKVWSIIYQYGPTWEKRLDIQKRLRTMTEAEMRTSAKMINNLAFNPSTEPTTSTTTELQTINQQSTGSHTTGIIDSYGRLWDLLATDVTEAFLNRFSKLFLAVAEPQLPLWYTTEVTE